MRKTYLSKQINVVHFIGIGGVGMSGIAEILLNLGYKVQGSDLKLSAVTARLEKKGARIFEGHRADNIEDADVVVVSSAINDDNAELIYARAKMLTIVKRAEMLAELMRFKSSIAVSGTHGKTTTTTFIGEMLVSSGFDPTIVNGGIIHQLNSNARLGQSEWMVLEADESDGTFTRLPASIAVVTNIDPEHLDFWKDFDALKQGFLDFIENIPFYGVAICCTDHPEVQALVGKIENRRIMRYGFNAQADIRADNVHFKDGKAFFDIVFADKYENIAQCVLPMPGAYNVLNALAAVGVGVSLGLNGAEIKKAFASFRGVKRRFNVIDEVKGIKIIDDYAHHPVEISEVLKAARQVVKGRVIAVHQPHRFSRLAHLFEEFCACFNEADFVAITDVFSAGEEPLENVNHENLVRGLGAYGHRHARAIDGLEMAKIYIKEHARSGDVVLCLGAGSIGTWAKEIADFLRDRTRHHS